MSYSNIIKLHKLRSQKMVVGRGSPGKWTGASFPLAAEDGALASNQDGNATGMAGYRQPGAWTGDPRELLRMAQAEAETILTEASNKAEEIRLQAYEEGYQNGQAEGLEEARAATSGHAKHVADLAENVAADMARILNNSEEGIVSLALAVAEKIVLRSLAEDRPMVVAMVKWALEQVDIMEVIRVRVNPEDYELLQSYWEDGQTGPGAGKFELTSDPRVQTGGCIIDTSKSVVDAQIGTKLAEIEQAFQSHMDTSSR